jgi:anti-sigma regulatory factor (Ser/Thr protein kinase)
VTRFSTELPVSNAAPAHARRALSEHLSADVERKVGATLRLLVSELVTNSVRHAPSRRDGDVRLDVHVRRDTVRVQVRDTGGGFERTTPKPRGADGGYGLFLVEKMAARWGIEGNGETCVWFELDLREAA